MAIPPIDPKPSSSTGQPLDSNSASGSSPGAQDPVTPQTSRGARTKGKSINTRLTAIRKNITPLTMTPKGQEVPVQNMADTNRPEVVLSSLVADKRATRGVDSSGKVTINNFSMYPVGDSEKAIYAHRFPQEPEREDMLALALQEKTEKIIALQGYKFLQTGYYLPGLTESGESCLLRHDTEIKSFLTAPEATFGDISVKVKKASAIDGFPEHQAQCLDIELRKSKGEPHELKVDQLYVWKDHEGIDPETAEKLIERVPDQKCQIHCLMGLGRTGSLIVMKQLKDQFKAGNLDKGHVVEFIVQAVRDGRAQRGSEQFVENEKQLKSILDFAKKLTTLSDQEIEAQLKALGQA